MDAVVAPGDPLEALGSLGAMLWETDPGAEGPMLSILGAPETVLGLSRDDCLTRRDLWTRLLHPDDHDRVLGARRRAPCDPAAEIDYRLLGRDGRVRWLRDRFHVAGTGAGRRLRVMTATIATPRLPAPARAANVPEDGETRFRPLADATPVPVWSAAPDGRRTFVNLAWLEFRGRTAAEEVGDGWQDGLHPEDRPAFTATVARALADGQGYRTEYRLRRADGEYRWIRESGVPHRATDGRLAGYVGSAIDVTDRRGGDQERACLLEALRRAQPTQVLGQLAGTVAHDFNNALATILGNVELVQAMLSDEGPEAEYLDEALEAGWRAQERIRQLLAWNRQKAAEAPALGIRSATAPDTGAAVVAGASAASGPGVPASRRHRILLVDDDAGLVDLWMRLLDVSGYDVVGRTEPRAALDLVELMPDLFDAIVTDDSMPDLTGQKLAAEIHRLRPGLPVILLTGSDPDTAPMAPSETGLRAVVLKPVTVEELAATIRGVLDPTSREAALEETPAG